MRAVEKSGAGVITRWRGSDYTSRFPQIDRNPLGGGLSARGSDCTWITVAIHRVFPQIGGMVTAGAHQVAGSVAKGGGCDFTSGTGDADTVASSPRCRHQHEAQRCRNGMTKGIGVLSQNRRNFRHPSSSPATSASRSIILPSLWKGSSQNSENKAR